MAGPLLRYSRAGLPAPDAPSLEVSGLSVRYPGATAPALQNVSLRVSPGTVVALVGPNGSGKSTLLKAAAGLLKPFGGAVRVFGLRPGACRERLAYLPQRSEIDWRFPISVRRLAATGRYVHLGWLRRPGRHDQGIVDAVLERLRLTDLAERQIGRLSGGQQQRALLARALAQQAPLLLLDEPFNAVDAETRAVILDVLAELRTRGTAVVVATHDHDRLPFQFDEAVELGVPRSAFQVPGWADLSPLSLNSNPAIRGRGTRNAERGTHAWIG